MASACHLLASIDPVAKAAMEETVTVLVPVQNPDGRDRFVHHFEVAGVLLRTQIWIAQSIMNHGPGAEPITTCSI